MHFLIHLSVSEMESAKNKQATKNSQEEIKKAAAFRAQGGGSLAQPLHASKKRKHNPDASSLGKRANSLAIRPEASEVVADAPSHGVSKGLMTSQGRIVPSPFPLLVKDREYTVNTAHSIVRDVDLDKCSEHETNPFGDSGFQDMMRVSLFHSSLCS